jgi:hypothetical protein
MRPGLRVPGHGQTVHYADGVAISSCKCGWVSLPHSTTYRARYEYAEHLRQAHGQYLRERVQRLRDSDHVQLAAKKACQTERTC